MQQPEFPLEALVRRGVVFLHMEYEKLDDPAFAGQTKPKYVVIISDSLQDDPILYLLTTSEKPKHSSLPNLVKVENGECDFLSGVTLIDVSQAGLLEFTRDELAALHRTRKLKYCGAWPQPVIDRILAAVYDCPSVARWIKQVLKGE